MSVAHPVIAVLSASAIPLRCLFYHLQKRSDHAVVFAYSNLACLTRRIRAPRWPVLAVQALEAVGLACLISSGAGIALPLVISRPYTAIVYCVDTSGSMATADVKPTRALAALRALEYAISQAPAQTRIGIVSFSGSAVVRSAVTADRFALHEAIASVPKPNGQTAIGDALQTAQSLLPSEGDRAIVLLTDGVNTTGSDPAAAEHAVRVRHVRLYRILIAPGFSARALESRVDALPRTRALRDLSPVFAATGFALVFAVYCVRIWAGRF